MKYQEALSKHLKDLKVKDVKPSISDVLYSADDVDPLTGLWKCLKNKKLRIKRRK